MWFFFCLFVCFKVFNVGNDFFLFSLTFWMMLCNISCVSLPGKLVNGVNQCFQIRNKQIHQNAAVWF